MPSKMKTRCDLCSKKCTDKIQLTWANVTYMGQREDSNETKTFCSNKCKIGFIRTKEREWLQDRKEMYTDIVKDLKDEFLKTIMFFKEIDDFKKRVDFYKNEIKYGSLLVEYVDDCFSLKKTEYELYEKYCKLKALSLNTIEFCSIDEEDEILDFVCKTNALLENTYEIWCVDSE